MAQVEVGSLMPHVVQVAASVLHILVQLVGIRIENLRFCIDFLNDHKNQNSIIGLSTGSTVLECTQTQWTTLPHVGVISNTRVRR